MTQPQASADEAPPAFGWMGAAFADALFAQTPLSIVVYDPAGRPLRVNRAFERLMGLRLEDVPPGYSVLDDPQLAKLGYGEEIRRAFEGDPVTIGPVRYDGAAVAPGGRVTWTQGHFFPVRAADGKVQGVVLVHVDLTDRVHAEEALQEEEQRLRQALDQRQFLVEVGELLAGSIDYEETLGNVAHLAVPRLADWCAVDIAGADGRLRRLAVAHPDPAKVELVREIVNRYPPDPSVNQGMYAILRSGQSQLVADVPDEMLTAAARDEEHLSMLRGLGLRSWMGVPLQSKGTVLGVIGFAFAESGRRFTADDLKFAEEVARRAAAAIENAQLLREVRDQRDELQRVFAEAEVARKRLEESERRFRDAADSAPVLIWTAGTDGERDWFNQPWLAFTGRTLEDERDDGWRGSVHPDDLARWDNDYRDAQGRREPFRTEYRLRRHDGSYRWVLAHAVPRWAVDGTFVGYIGSCIDITEHRETEDALRRSEALLSGIIGSAMDAIVSVDQAQSIVAFNAAAERMFGYRPDEVLGTVLDRLIPERYRSTHASHVASFGRTGVTSRSMGPLRPLSARRRDGTEFPIEATISQAEAGGQKVYSVIIRDISERVRSEERKDFLERATRVLSQTIDLQDTLVALTRHAIPMLADYCSVDLVTDDGKIVRVESAHCDPQKEVVVRELWSRYPYSADDRVGTPQVIRSGEGIFMAEITPEQVDSFAKDEEHRRMLRALAPRSYICVPLTARGNTFGALALVLSDSGRRYTEEDFELAVEMGRRAGTAVDNARLYHAEQAARRDAEEANRAKAEFLATMSHELRTPLNAIAGYAQLIQIGVHGPVSTEQAEALERIMRSEEHLLSLINDLLNYAKLEAGRVHYDIQRVVLADALPELEGLMRPEIERRGLGYRCAPIDRGLVALADVEKLRQVMLNLLSNAVKYTPRGGEISVDAERGDDAVSISVRDSGAGIPADKLEEIFEPFVQLHRRFGAGDEGTGLGLAISRDLAVGMGGDLTVTSEPGRGSVFTVTLPAAPDA